MLHEIPAFFLPVGKVVETSRLPGHFAIDFPVRRRD